MDIANELSFINHIADCVVIHILSDILLALLPTRLIWTTIYEARAKPMCKHHVIYQLSPTTLV
jgi:hypothetical protein